MRPFPVVVDLDELDHRVLRGASGGEDPAVIYSIFSIAKKDSVTALSWQLSTGGRAGLASATSTASCARCRGGEAHLTIQGRRASSAG